ncbi:hypothetical protein BK769_00690 [Bacillus thuringiensis serovar kumamtoensis]|uniref:Uncharacterized protein n=2 Tax=Bacillus cereus group TaxID=86661 RepID=A0A9X6JP25_BACUK|nr:hypothetical protein BK769_16785 [Bacillus thuringiensis serovar kumamtoensis]OTZ71730.1 hypothetical protein BK769_16740 [Bacillus thuringiensis serovar kumamtoensis]OTZ72769.1 hypothetical protein BK769_15410 [Bacillus thuringiensis serovar kumamtoensis]OTZ79659.1 hypothetical protein BK769_00690 [Bacillus thuringiensis serovar kumamtoensis]
MDMDIEKLSETINKQNLYIEQILLKSIQLIQIMKSKSLSKNEVLIFEYHLVILSNYLLTEINLIKRKKNMYIHLMNILGESSTIINNKIDSLISHTLLSDLKKNNFSNTSYRSQFTENINQLELHLFDFNKKIHSSAPILNPWFNQDL